MLYVTGTASVLIGEAASSLLARTNLAVSISVTDARLVKGGLPFRGAAGEPSPYNPPLRHLLSEKPPPVAQPQSTLTASLVGREVLTPSVARFTFELSSSGGRSEEEAPSWQAGQHVTFDFAPELYSGYSHMRDDDPQSINDDFTRTFTVSSEPARGRLEITARRHGPATGLLWRQNLRAPLELRVLGFGGEAAFRLPTTTATEAGKDGVEPHEAVYVAGGVGVTPLLAQAREVLAGGPRRLRVLWTLRGEDLGLAARAFADVPGLAGATTLFVTGPAAEAEEVALAKLRGEAAGVETRRVSEGDVAALKGGSRTFYLCAGPGLRRRLEEWLEGEKTAWEDFGY